MKTRWPVHGGVLVLGMLLLVVPLGGCSVGMALSGEKTADLSVCRIGAARSDIDVQLGPPVSVESLPNGGQRCTYEYQVGNEPSAGRAVAHGAMDVLTLGIWELVGTPIELVQGQKYELTVVYDADDRARQITTRKLPDKL